MRLALLVIAGLGAACGGSKDNPEARGIPSPFGTWILKTSFYEGALVRLTVVRASDGVEVDRYDSRETDLVKWVAGWADDRTVVFHGTDTGRTIARRYDDAGWRTEPVTGAACARLHALFVARFGRDAEMDCR